MKHLKFFIFLFSLLVSSLLFAAKAENVEAINAAIIDDVQTITVFFKKPQTLNQSEAQKLFTVEHSYEYLDEKNDKRKPLTTGQWHLSSDGYQLSYYPVPMGSYRVVDNKQNRTSVYVGMAGKAVNIIGRGPVLPLSNGALPIEAIGTPEVDVEFFKIDNPALLFERFYIGSSFDEYDLKHATKNMTPAGIFRYTLPKNAAIDRKTEHRIPIDKNIKPGAYIVVVNPSGQIIDKNLDVRMVFISDIGIHARRYPNKTLIMANSFSQLKPVQNATLEIWRNEKNKLQISQEQCQFQDGICLINRALSNSDVVVVKNGGDMSLLPMRELALDLNDFAILGAPYAAQPVHVYSNRTLYRPGEEITINALLRNQDGKPLAPQSLELSLIDPEGKAVQTSVLKEITQGFYQTRIATNSNAKTGVWKVEMRTDSRMQQPNGSLTLHIEEFMPERMELVLKPNATVLNHNQSLKLDIMSRYLFGAPAKDNLLTGKVYFDVLRTPYAGHKDWYVGKTGFPSYALEERSIELEDKLNEQGEITQLIALPFEDDKTPKISQVIRASGTVNVMDGSVLGISRSFKADFWPSEATVPVIRPLFNNSDLGYGQKANFELFNADKNGSLTEKNLKLTLKYQSDYCTWVYSESRGWDCYESGDDYQIYEQKIIKVGKTPITYSVDPNSWGKYQLILTDVSTGFETVYHFNSSWRSSDSGQMPVAKPLALNIATDKVAYQDGETVNLTFDAPSYGHLMVMIEADEPLFKQVLHVQKGKNNLTFKLDENWQRHDLYVTALLLGKNAQNEVTRSLGVIPLKLDRAKRRIKAKLEFPTVALPDNLVKVKLKVDNLPKNEKAYATLSITDQGILNMTPTKPKNIFNEFFGQKKYNVDIIDYYNRLFKNSSKSLLTPKFGGDDDPTDNKSDSNLTEMKTVSIASNLITLNDKGEAVAEFYLPDFNGEAKVVAKVFSAQNVGETSEQMTIRAPIVADLVTPKFVRVGDESYVSLSLHNLSGIDDQVKVKLESKEFEAKFNKTISLKNQESMRKLIPIKLQDFYQKAVLSLNIEAKSFKAVRTYRIGTVHFADEISEFERRFLDKDQDWRRNSELRSAYGRSVQENLIVSRTPIINVLTYTNDLFGYPYGCTEQTTSRAFPWLFKSHPVLDYEKKRVYKDYEEEQKWQKNFSPIMAYADWETNLMASAINKIAQRQLTNGGFSLWDGGSSPHLPATVYATDFLYQAAKKYPQLVRSEILNNVSSYLKKKLTSFSKELEHKSKYDKTSSNLNDMTYAAWILAREGKIFSADLAAFNANIINEMSPLSRAYIAGAHFILGNDKQGQEIMSRVSFVDWKYRYGYFYTGIAETALTIDLINQLRVRGLYKNSGSLVADLAQVLHSKLKERHYFSTQERYALIKIGVDTPADANPIVAKIDGKSTKLTSGQAIDVSKIATLKSSEPLFLEYQIKGYPNQKRSTDTFNASLNIDYKGLNNNIGQNTFEVKVGDRFLVQVELNSERNLPNALLVSQIPGGFNLVNPNLMNGSVDDFYRTFSGYKGRSSNIFHEEFRFNSYLVSLPVNSGTTYKFAYVIEAAVPGTYEVPSLTLEDMYLPTLKKTVALKAKIAVRKP